MAATKWLLVDKNANRVLFAEAGKDFVDFLFYLLSLPVSAVIRLISNASMVGSLGNLYQSIENLDEIYMQPNQNKDLLLKPQATNHVAEVPLLLPKSTTPAQKRFYRCSNYTGHRYVTDCPDTICPSCRNKMNSEVPFIGKDGTPKANDSTSDGGFVKGLVTYMVTDELSVSPMSMISGVALVNKYNGNYCALEERVVEFGTDEGLKLLKVKGNSFYCLSCKAEEQGGGSIKWEGARTCDRCSELRLRSLWLRMSQEVRFVGMNNASAATTNKPTSSAQGGYVKELVTYMVRDDSTVSPMSMVSGVSLLNRFNITNFSILVEKVVEFGIDKGVESLKASLLSKDALTSVFLPKQRVRGGAPSSGN